MSRIGAADLQLPFPRRRPKRALVSGDSVDSAPGASASGLGPSHAGPAIAVDPPSKRARLAPPTLTPPAAAALAAAPIEVKVILVRNLTKQRPKLEEDGFKIINVTSKSDDTRWKKLSPFYPHRSIPVPGSPGTHSYSVEGLWQGLKVFQNEGVDESKFTNNTEKNLKRAASKEGRPSKHGKARGKVLHHWWGPLPSSGAAAPLDELEYVEARRRIYVPAYEWVLANKVPSLVRELARESCKSKIALIDYFVNDDVTNTHVPLSHAGLLRQYILRNFQDLVA